jgi:hypothetical protein
MHVRSGRASRASGRGLFRRGGTGKASGTRKLRIEGLESRQLLAITPLITDATQVRAIVPTSAQFTQMGQSWTGGDEPFDDALWLATDSTAPNGIGYDNAPSPYLPFVDVNVGAAMINSPTAFVRIPFTVADPSAFNRLVLKLRYDDAFVAYVNGTEVARSQTAPAGYPERDALATATHDALLQPGNAYAGFDLGSLVGVLQAGPNVLAIRGFNATLGDDDFLIQATLEGQTPGNAPVAVNDSASYTVGTDPNPVINVLANDTVGSDPIAPSTVRISTPPANGTATVNPTTGAITYVANASFRGTDTLQYTVEDNTSAIGDNRLVIPQNHPVRAFIPVDAGLGTTWLAHDFDDTAWLTGTGSAGFDQTSPVSVAGDFTPALVGGVDLAAMRNVNPSAYTRYFFELTDQELAEVDSLSMRLRWDDGFVAYLNGVEIARSGIATPPSYNSVATTNRNDATPLTFATLNPQLGAFNAAAAKSALRSGGNVLAIQVLNVAANNEDLLIHPELTIRSKLQGRVSNEATVTINANTVNPFARDDTATSIRGTAVTIPVLSNDVAGAAPLNPASVAIATAPANGMAVLDGQGRIIYTPNPSFTGTDSFTYTVEDTSLDGPVQPGRAYSMISRNATWRYNDSGTDLGVAWRASTYNDMVAGWKGGAGTFGYGPNAVATVINCDPTPAAPCAEAPTNANDNYITHYFRTKFTVGAALDLSQLSFMQLDLLRDDGLVVYLNGSEIFRENMPAGAVTAATLASAGDPATYFIRNIQLSSLPAGLLVNGENTLAVELHQNANSTSDAAFDLALALVEGDRGPRLSNPGTVNVTVSLGSPVANNDSALIPQGSNVVIPLTANDTSGSTQVQINPATVVITQQPTNGTVQILTGTQAGQVRYTPDAAFFGTDMFRYTVRDTTPPAAPVTSTVVPIDAVWRYLDTGTDQGTAWRAPAFSDANWPMGAAELGYGDNQTTTVGFGPNAAMKYPTTYFRHKFTLSDPSRITAMSLSLIRDDGAIIYINGVEAMRDSMPAGNVLFNQFANVTQGGAMETTPVVRNLNAAQITPLMLVAGENTIAVEVHQDQGGSSDISFSLEVQITEAGVPGVLSNPATVTVQVNARPVADNETVTLPTNQSITIPVLDGDVDPAQTFGQIGIAPGSVAVTQPAAGRGTVTANPDGTVTYTPPAQPIQNPGPVTFTYTVADVMPGSTNARSLPATVTINITVQPPSTTPDYELTPRDTPIELNPINREADTPGFFPISQTSIQISTPPTVGTAAVVNTSQGQRILYTPPAGFTGVVTLNYTIADINGNRSAPGVARIEVYEPAVARLDTFPTRTNTPLTINSGQLMVNDVRIDYQAAVELVTVLDTAQGGTIVQTGNTLTYTPAPGFVGIDSFLYRLRDTQIRTPVRVKNPSNEAIVEIAVGAVTVDGYVYVDLNQNGVRDTGETGVPGALITLTRHAGGVSDRTFSTTHVTNAQGFYSFATTTGLPMVPGDYTIAESPPFTFTNNALVPANRYDRIPLVADSQNHDINFRKFGPATSFFPFFINYGGGFLASQQPVNLAAGSLVVPYTDWDGAFTAQATYAPAQGSVEMRLYGGNGALLAVSGAAAPGDAGLSQKTLSYNPAPSQPLVLVMSGNNTYVNASMPSQGESIGDVTAPLVRDVLLGSTSWSAAFVNHLRQAGMGDGGYSIMHSGPSLPWGNLDQVTVRFSEDVVIGPWDLAVWGVNTLDQLRGGAAVQNFQYDPMTYTATWTLTQPFSTDRMRIRLSDSVMDGVGNALVGDASGGGLDLALAVLPGDVNHGGATTMASVTGVMRHMMTRAGDDGYSIYHDLDGNGRINAVDAVLVRNQIGNALPAGSPGGAAAPASIRASVPDRGGFAGGVAVQGAAIREISTVAVQLVPTTSDDSPAPGRLRAIRSAVDLALADLSDSGEASSPSTRLTARASRAARSIARPASTSLEL